MTDELTIDAEQYISSKRASELSGYEQDYIGQLCRGGSIKARRVGGLWYVSSESLKMYKERADEYKPEPPVAQGVAAKPDTLISFEGRGYISTSRAAKLTGYSPDYIGQMARANIIPSRQVGNRWYVEQEGLIKHKESKDALLGAVQTQSVGLGVATAPRVKSSNTYFHPIHDELYRYTSENADLLPELSLGKTDLLVSATDDVARLQMSMPTPSAEEPFAEAEEEENIIPIHISHGKTAFSKPYPIIRAMNVPVYVEPRRMMLPMLLPAAVLTIVVVLSLGFISLKNSSIYTVNSTKSGSAVSQLAGAGISFVARAGDTLEILFVPELVYQRKN